VHDRDALPVRDSSFLPGGELISDTSSVSCSSSDPCFVVAGSNQNRPVRADAQLVDPGNVEEPNWYPESNGLDYRSSFELDKIADKTNQTDTDVLSNIRNDQLYQHYPGELDAELRNPYDVWDNNPDN